MAPQQATLSLLGLPDKILEKIVEQCTYVTDYDNPVYECPVCGPTCKLFSEMPEDEFDCAFPPPTYERLRDCPDCGLSVVKISPPAKHVLRECCHSSTRALVSATAQRTRPDLAPPSQQCAATEMMRHFPKRRPTKMPGVMLACRRLNKIGRKSYYGNNTFSFCLSVQQPGRMEDWLMRMNMAAVPFVRKVKIISPWSVASFAEYIHLLAFARRRRSKAELIVEFVYKAKVEALWVVREVTVPLPKCLARRAKDEAVAMAELCRSDMAAIQMVAAKFFDEQVDPATLPLDGCKCDECTGLST